MGFIFLTLAIYQAEAAWWGERGGSNSPTHAAAQQGNSWFMVSLPFHITLFLSCLFPSLPAAMCLLPLLPPLSTHPYVFYQAILISPSLPMALSCTPFFTTAPSLLFLHPSSSPPPLTSISSLCCRTLGTMAPCTSPRWQRSTWETTVAMPTAMKTSIRHMCCRWMVSSGSFLTSHLG